jgi:hypothetical protein
VILPRLCQRRTPFCGKVVSPSSISGALDIAQTVIDLGLAISRNPGKDRQLSSVAIFTNLPLPNRWTFPKFSEETPQNQLRKVNFPNFVQTTLMTVTDDN